MSWRLKWAMQQFFDRQLRLRNRELLNNPAAYYASILLKMVPGIYPPPLQLRFRHSPHSFPVGSFMTAFIYKEIFADSDYDIALAMPRPSILDVGANTGLFALRMKQLYPEARIACFEPEENNFTQLERLIRDNQLEGVRAIRKGLGAKTGTAVLYLHPQNIGGHSIIRQGRDWKPRTIELLSLADALRTLPDGICHLMKLDCEGAEYEIIRSMDLSLAARVHCVLFEGSAHLYNIEELDTHLKSLGYMLERRHGLAIARSMLSAAA